MPGRGPLALPAAIELASPARTPLVRLEPITPEGIRELAPGLRQPQVFASGYGGGPAGLPADDEAFVSFMRGYLPPGGRAGVGFLVRLAAGAEAGAAIGTSSFINPVPEREEIEIGCTAYDPRAWGTAVNPAVKLALLGHAFATGYHRVVFNVDIRNERSLTAVARLGATREGVLREHMRRADGSWRDTVTHSVLSREWPRVRDGLLERLRGTPPVLRPSR